MTQPIRKLSPEGLANLRANAERARAARLMPRRERPAPRGESLPAGFEEVSAWAEKKGILFREWDDLPRVNAVRDRANLLPFKRLFPVKGRRG